MVIAETPRTRDDLERTDRGGGHGLLQPTTSQLYTHALARGDARTSRGRAARGRHGHSTGRSPKDKFIVREPGSEDRIWWGDVNAALSEDAFEGCAPR